MAAQSQPQPPQRETARDRILEGLFLGSPVPMLLVEVRSRRITRVNAALERLLGYAPDDLAGQGLSELDQGDADDLSEHLLLALACGDQGTRRRTWKHASGATVPVDVQATRLHGDRGTLLVLYVRDARPDPEVVQHELDLQERMMRKHEALGRLSVGLAQEFESILDGLSRTAGKIRKDAPANTSLTSALAEISDSGSKARGLIRDFLAFTGQQTLRPQMVSLNQVVAEVEDTLREGIPQDVGLMVRLCDEATDVTVDPEQLREILVRLVERAHQAMPDGGYAVVSTEAVTLDEAFARDHPPTRPGPHVVLGVTDTGEALDEEAQRRVFEPFYSSQEQGQGSGLGLATVYGMAKQSGGTIWVTSREGAGTTFRVYLPRVEG